MIWSHLQAVRALRLGTVHELTNVMDKSVETSQMSLVLYFMDWAHIRPVCCLWRRPVKLGFPQLSPSSIVAAARCQFLRRPTLILTLYFCLYVFSIVGSRDVAYRVTEKKRIGLAVQPDFYSKVSMHYHMTTAAKKAKDPKSDCSYSTLASLEAGKFCLKFG